MTTYKHDQKARRLNLNLPGGTVVLGNGKIPNFIDAGLLAKGYYFAFQIDALDDQHFPLDRLKGLSLAFGVSSLPARHRNCRRPMYGYEIPDAVLFGYGNKMIEKGKWIKTCWDPKSLQVNDIVGLLVAEDGDLVVFVNEKQVLRVKTSLNDEYNQQQQAAAMGGSSSSFGANLLTPQGNDSQGSRNTSKRRSSSKYGPPPIKRVLFPIIDLHGRVSAVTLLARSAPPNVPLECRDKPPAQ